jgi:hypothetical protein
LCTRIGVQTRDVSPRCPRALAIEGLVLVVVLVARGLVQVLVIFIVRLPRVDLHRCSVGQLVGRVVVVLAASVIIRVCIVVVRV